MKKLLLTLTALSVVFGYQNCHEETGWCYEVSTQQAFYMFAIANVDGDLAEVGADVIGAFCNGTMVGWFLAAESYTTVPAMGDDGSFPDYCHAGDVPTFQVYDASNGSILNGSVSEEVPGWAISEIYILGSIDAGNTFGCTDPDACNYNPDATADDGSCVEFDCAGECGGSAEVDDCGVCNGGNADMDCAGVCFGLSLDTWCDGSCAETGPVFDDCGECGGDNSSCTGCTDPLADNYDSGNIFDDGSCDYTVPAVDDLSAEPGPARVILSWSAPEQMGESSYSYDVYDDGGNVVKTVVSTTTQILNLEAGVEYCYTVVAVNDFGSSDPSNSACAVPFEAAGMTWGFQVSVTINGYDTFLETDDQNFFGVAGDATNTYDNAYDIPEAPTPVGNYVQFYFPHSSGGWANPWESNHFTQDVRLEDTEYFEHNLIVWTGEAVSNMDGDVTFTFDGINESYPGYTIYALLDGSYHSVSDGTVLGSYLNANESKSIDIILGDIVPQEPDDLISDGGDRSIALAWSHDGDDLSDIGNRYPATSYNLYRDGVLVSNLSGNSYLDDEDMEGWEGQGLLYESSYDYTLTGLNASGESTDGNYVTYSDNSVVFFAGRESNTSSTTDDNIDPVSSVAHVASEDGNNISDGVYEVPHNNDPDANLITIHIDGSGSSDADEFDSISRFGWSQTDGPGDISLDNADSDDVSFTVSNAFDGSAKSYSFNLHVEADYPIKGGIGTRTDDAQISVTILPEPNDGPDANLVVAVGYGDYHIDEMLWVVPHDGTPETITAAIGILGNGSSDPESDQITFVWNTGVEPEPFTDLNDNGVRDNNEPYIDSNGNGQWDAFEPYTTENIFVDRIAEVYTFSVVVTDAYGYSDNEEIIVLVLPEPNEAPTADAGTDQLWYMLPDDDCFATSVDGTISDPDEHYETGEPDVLSWSWSDGDPDIDHDVCLPVGEHTLTLCTADLYGANHCDDMTITILDEPAPAQVEGLSSTHSLYFIELSWLESDLTGHPIELVSDFGANAVNYEVYRDGSKIADVDEDHSGSLYYLDNGLDPSTEYCYSIVPVNSHGFSGDATSDDCESTGDRPTITVTSPNGAEIWSVDDPYPVTWSLTDNQYISRIEVYYSDERQDETSEDVFATDTGAGSLGLNVENTTLTGHAASISDVYEEASIRIAITDIGDYFGNNTDGSEDASDNVFTMSTHMLTRDITSGWHLFGTALDPFFNTMEENLSPDLGDWGSGWIAYDQDGGYTDLELTIGQGYYLAASSDFDLESLTLNGDVVTSDDFSRADLSLDGGWTLISDPLVVTVDKNRFTVTTNDETYSWEDAVDFGFVSPSVYGWDDGNVPVNNIERFQGYWIHTSRSLDLHIRPHLDDDMGRTNENDFWKLTMTASDENGVAGSDLITVGLSENATDDFKYGEDEYDLPDPMIDSYVDLFVKNFDWLGREDINGNMVETPYFTADIRTIPEYDEVQVWNVSGAAYNVTGNVKLAWSMNELDEAYNMYLVVNGNAIDMRTESSVIVSQEDISDMTILVGSGDMGINSVEIPEEFALNAAYPNPFNPVTNMTLALNADAQVKMTVYNLVGQVVDVVVDGFMNAGYHNITWDAGNIPSGVYIVKVNAGTNVSTQKVMLMK